MYLNVLNVLNVYLLQKNEKLFENVPSITD